VKESIAAFGKGRLRRLSAEEIELWLSVTKTVAPRPSRILPRPAPTPDKGAFPTGNSPPPKEAEPKRNASAQNPPPKRETTAAPKFPPLAPLERRLRQKLARGRAAPDAAIDLHGLRSHEAVVALQQFLSRAQRDGAKLVLVVTGKGERDASGDGSGGVLRRSVPQWLRGPDYHKIVVGFEEATRPHGGAGALYVRIKRRDRVAREKDF
jgi:DNA-nicking Smr family endonuclease